MASAWPTLCDPTLAFAASEFSPLVEIWRRAAEEGRLPLRQEIDLRSLKKLLRELALYERVSGRKGRHRVRLMGSEFADAMGDLSGRFLDEAVAPEHLPRWQAALDAAFEAGAPLRFIGQLDVSDKPYMLGEYFEAPLIAEDGSPSLILAAGHFTPGDWADWAQRESRRLKVQVFG